MIERDAADQASGTLDIFARRLEAGRLSLEYVFDQGRPDITDYTAAPEYQPYQPRRQRTRPRRSIGPHVPLIPDPSGAARYALRCCGTAEVIGNVAASGMNGGDMMMVGWSLIPAARGQGYGTEAALLLCDLLFCLHPQVQMLMAHTFARHTISRRVMEKIGMIQYHMPWRAQFRMQWWYREWYQVVSYFITRKTWTRMQAESH